MSFAQGLAKGSTDPAPLHCRESPVCAMSDRLREKRHLPRTTPSELVRNRCLSDGLEITILQLCPAVQSWNIVVSQKRRLSGENKRIGTHPSAVGHVFLKLLFRVKEHVSFFARPSSDLLGVTLYGSWGNTVRETLPRCGGGDRRWDGPDFCPAIGNSVRSFNDANDFQHVLALASHPVPVPCFYNEETCRHGAFRQRKVLFDFVRRVRYSSGKFTEHFFPLPKINSTETIEEIS